TFIYIYDKLSVNSTISPLSDIDMDGFISGRQRFTTAFVFKRYACDNDCSDRFIFITLHLFDGLARISYYTCSWRIIYIPVLWNLCKEKNCLNQKEAVRINVSASFYIINDSIQKSRIMLLIFKISTNQHLSSNRHRPFINIEFWMMVWIRMFRYVCTSEKEGTRFIL